MCVLLLAHMLLADPAKEAPPPVPTSAWNPGLVFNILDPRAELLGPGSSKYDSIEAVEDKWPTVFGTDFPVSTIRSGRGSGKPTATEQKKVKEKNVGKKKKNKEEEEKEEGGKKKNEEEEEDGKKKEEEEEEEEEGKKKKNEEEEEEGKKKKKKKKNKKKEEEEAMASLLSAGSLELGMRFWAK
jgi:type IV secretory pathway VirB10-like protein